MIPNIYLSDEQIEDAKLFQIIGSKDKAIAKAAAENAVKKVVEYLDRKLNRIYVPSGSGAVKEMKLRPEDWQALRKLKEVKDNDRI